MKSATLDQADLPAIMTKQDLAKWLGVSDRQIERYISEGKLKANRIGHRTLRIRREHVLRFLNRNET